MTVTDIAPRIGADILRKVTLGDDMRALSPDERMAYVAALCAAHGLDSLLKPFSFFEADGRLICYATRACTDQLRANRAISITITGREKTEDIYMVTAQAKDAKGRTDESIGVIMIQGLAPNELANAMMIAETRAKRRVTLSICGLGVTDESELSSIPQQPTREEFRPASAPPRLSAGEQPASVIPPKRARITSGAADIRHDGSPLTDEQLLTIEDLRKRCGGKWCTTEEDARSGWRKILCVYRGELGERITSARTLSPAQAEHLIKRMEEYHDKRTADIKPIDIGHIPEPQIDADTISQLETAITDVGFDEQEWLFGLFGVEKAKALTVQQASVAFELLLAKHKDDDTYGLALERAIRSGFVHDSRGA